MKAENRWASVTFDVLTCPALAAKQLWGSLAKAEEWWLNDRGLAMVPEDDDRWALSFLGPGGQVLCPLTVHSSLGLVGKCWSRAWATWKWLQFCGDRAPALDVPWLVNLSPWTQVSSVLVGPQGELTASSGMMPLLSTGWPAFDGCLLSWSCYFCGGLFLKAQCSFCIFFNSKIQGIFFRFLILLLLLLNCSKFREIRWLVFLCPWFLLCITLFIGNSWIN